MFDKEKFNYMLSRYKSSFQKHWKGEVYKWEAIKWFQDNWDIEADDFAGMFKRATDKAKYLLDSGYYFPRGMIIQFAIADTEATRAMFRNLFDESQNLALRVEAFENSSEEIRSKYGEGSWKNHYQNTNAISTYLWLRYPDKYYIYKYNIYRFTATELDSDYKPKRDGSVETMIGGFQMYDEICSELSKDDEIRMMLKNTLTEKCYSDPELKTLTIDFGYYIGAYYQYEKKNETSADGWIPANYVSPFSVDDWKEMIADQSIFTTSALQVLKCLKDYGGQATCKQLSVKYGETPNFYSAVSSTLAQKIAEKYDLEKVESRPGKFRYWPILFTGKKADKDDEGNFIWRLRDELSTALDQVDLSDVPLYAETNQTSETQQYWWLTANPKIWSWSDIQIGDQQSYTLYNENGNKRRIFQNFLDVKAGDMVIGYEANPVKRVVAIGRIEKENDGKEIWFSKTEGLVSPIEYSVLKEAPELEKMEFLVQANGSLFKLTKGEYDFIMDIIREENPVQPVNAIRPKYTKEDFLQSVYMDEARFDVLVSLLKNKKNLILEGAPGVGKTFSAKRLAYAMMGEIDDSRIEMVQFHQNYSYEDFVMGYRPDGSDFKLTEGIFYRFCQIAANHPNQDYFFIIDEINRANLSKVFGELLMLIEAPYRETKVTLAYSGTAFYIPKNLYIIGLMNTADRSLAMIDYALRRRFSFYDMEPGFNSEGFQAYQKQLGNETFDNLIAQIKRLNQAIAEDKSLGRGFQIGHSYFCGRENLGCDEEWMRSVVEFDILPTLREYWFDEPKKITEWEKNLNSVFDD